MDRGHAELGDLPVLTEGGILRLIESEGHFTFNGRHDEKQPTRIKNFYSLHSIVGLLTLCLLVAQWLGGLYAFWWPQVVGESRALLRAVHARVGLVLALVIIVILNDFAIISIAYDYVEASAIPETWTL